MMRTGRPLTAVVVVALLSWQPIQACAQTSVTAQATALPSPLRTSINNAAESLADAPLTRRSVVAATPRRQASGQSPQFPPLNSTAGLVLITAAAISLGVLVYVVTRGLGDR